ncbi:sushi, von Willebrand factor type A, EGF and pentraxin domain containing 1, mRNA protein [Elysia marginata]|uniref:Sushi, von Willebrand factor type A, EGF and pentraxin domain containing 1, mRNA protein n=1 Tax=Elysia marginata TaxID=1093978 RepID=A0AAV4I2D7_9GAST|nr:sushi, von Willebrand factor type A, EGF and pentraxin domain containing 1, mRNA protein [Elysia marginata]
MASFWRLFLPLVALNMGIQCEKISSSANGTEFFRHIYDSLASTGKGAVSDKNPSDLIFIIDRPGRGTAYATGFHFLLGFVQSFLRNVAMSKETSRVALVISDQASCTVAINGVSSSDITKCDVVYKLRKARQESVVSFEGDQCKDPVSEAIAIAKSGRPDASKVVIVMGYGTTPGLQRVPDNIMEALHNLTLPEWKVSQRGQQTQVFAVGVGKANMTQMSRVASPGVKNWTYLKTFRALVGVARSLENSSVFGPGVDTRATNKRWARETTQASFACSLTCDDHALCSCSLSTGQTLCICLPGFFGNGRHCTPCPRGTYKEDTSARRQCVPCPVFMGTRDEAATSRDLCQPGLPRDIEKSINSCPELLSVAYAVRFGVSALVPAGVRNTGLPCTYKSGTSCHFGCRPGFRMIGLPGMLCRWDGTWGGQFPRCVKISDSDCGTLEEIGQQDPNGETSYVNNVPVSNIFGKNHRNSGRASQNHPFSLQNMRDPMTGRNSQIFGPSDSSLTRQGAVLEVDCPTSWRLWGDAVRTCSSAGIWSSTPARCIDPSCPPVPLTKGLKVYPRQCSEKWQTPGTACQLTCGAGYRLLGSSNITCSENRRWKTNPKTANSQVLGICLDEEPPSLTCRDNITIMLPREDQAMLKWEQVSPQVSDNSGYVTLTSPDITGSPFPVYFGNQSILFQASDGNHTVSCVLGVQIKDPRVRVLKCPSEEVTIYTRHSLDRLELPDVKFAIMGGAVPEPVGHRCSPSNHSIERIGRHEVVCWAYAPQGYLGAECRFGVNIRHEICPLPPPPRHGHLHCSPTNVSTLSCTVSCEPGYQFHEMPEEPYLCGLNGRWQHRKMWPDCSSSYIRFGAMVDSTYSLSLEFSNASDCLARKLQVQTQALTIVQPVLDTECDEPGECAVIKLNVACFESEGEDLRDYADVYDVYRPVLNYTIKANMSAYSMQQNVGILENISRVLAPLLANITHDIQHSSQSDRYYGVDCMLGYQALADLLCDKYAKKNAILDIKENGKP